MYPPIVGALCIPQLCSLRTAGILIEPFSSAALCTRYTSIPSLRYYSQDPPTRPVHRKMFCSLSLGTPSQSSFRTLVRSLLPIQKQFHSTTCTARSLHTHQRGCVLPARRQLPNLTTRSSNAQPHLHSHNFHLRLTPPFPIHRSYSRLFKNMSHNKQQRGRTIRAKILLLIDETGTSLGVMDKETALQLAGAKGLEIVQVQKGTADSNVVCKLVSRKQLWEEQKITKEKNKKDPKNVMKEVVVSVSIAEHDLATKVHHMRRFLEKLHSVEVSIEAKRKKVEERSADREKQMAIVNEIARQLEGVAVRVGTERQHGRRLIVAFRPASA